AGKAYDFLGWRRAYIEDVDEGDEVEAEARLPAVAEGAAVSCTELASVSHETKPPARYTEASLVKELEERGIGRPSTYAAVIETIQARGYVWRKGTALVPNWTAFGVTNLLEQHFGHLVDYGFTATIDVALDLIAKQAAGPVSLGTDPESGLAVYALTGRFGPYVQLGEQEEGTKKKPKRSSLFASQTPETVTLDEALQLLSLPRSVGVDAEDREILASPGRFGPYLKRADGETRSLATEEQLLTITLAEAEALYAQPKARRGRQQKPPLAELGEHPDSGAPVRVL